MQKILDSAERQTSNYRWIILVLTTLSGFLVMGFPTTGLSALFSEIADSVNLDLIQIGVVWGVGTVMGIITTLISGPLVDYFGTRRSLVLLCVAIGVTGALRGFAVNFETLFITSFLFGMVQPVLPMNMFKLHRQWFAPTQLGLANGVMSAGFATGLMLGSRLSATFLSPMLGGWRGVLIFLGVLSVIIGVLWAVIHPPMEKSKAKPPSIASIIANVKFVMRYRQLWVYAIAVFGVLGLMRGVVGYVPTYLREIGWTAENADTALTIFFFASLIGVIPISYISDRLGNRHIVMMVGATMLSLGVFMMFFVQDSFWGVMVAMAISGFFFDSFMAMNGSSVTEIRELDITMVGSALGFVAMMQNISATFVPPLGNALSTIRLNVPFLLWGASGVLAVVILLMGRQR